LNLSKTYFIKHHPYILYTDIILGKDKIFIVGDAKVYTISGENKEKIKPSTQLYLLT
jgi:hypothetical protein